MSARRPVPVMFLLAAAALFGVLTGATTGRRLRTEAAESMGTASTLNGAESTPRPKTRTRTIDWRQIESGDPKQLMVNLQAAGCPLEIAAAIVRGRIFRDCQAQVNAIFNPLAHYWSSSSEMKPVDDQIKVLRDKRDALASELNVAPEQLDSGFTAEKNLHISEAWKLYPKVQLDPNPTQEQKAQAAEARRNRISYLSQYLTPDELLTYRITQDGNAVNVGHSMASLHLSDGEFRNVFSVLDGEDLSRTNGFFSPAVEAKAREALGEDRYAEYRQQMAPENIIFNIFAQTFRLTDDQIQQLKELRASAGPMPSEEYKAAVAQVLGPNGPALHQYFSDPHIFRGGQSSGKH